MEHEMSAYGLWGLVIVNSLVFILFAFSFFKPHSPRDWRTFGTFAAFIVALFVEMYGVLLTLLMFPVLVLMYVHLAHQEERWAAASFGEQWQRYRAQVPAFLPQLRRPTAATP